MFRGKESSNRIQISWLIQDLLNFGVLGSLRLWGGGRWLGGVWRHLGAWRMSPHMCTWTCMHAHVYMYRNCKWPPTWRHPCLSCLTCMWVCVCLCMHGCMNVHSAWGTPHTHTNSTPIQPPATPRGRTPRITKNSITLELIKIISFCLKIWNLLRIPHPWVCVWFGGLVGGVRSNC